MGKIVTVSLPHDLPENWNENQYVSPGGTEVGLTERHGYNYLMKQVNATQRAALELDESVGNIAGNMIGVNLLANSFFVDPVVTNSGYVVPAETLYYSDTSLTTVAGSTTAKYQAVEYVDGIYGKFMYEGVTYYIDWSKTVRGFEGMGQTIDRWTVTNGNYTYVLLQNDGIMFGNAGNDVSYIQHNTGFSPYHVIGQHFTVSALTADGQLVTDTSKVYQGEVSWELAHIALGGVHVYVASNLTSFFGLQMTIDAGTECKIKALKLEFGTIQTLAHKNENDEWVLNEVPRTFIEAVKCNGAAPYGLVKSFLSVETESQVNAAIDRFVALTGDNKQQVYLLEVTLSSVIPSDLYFITVRRHMASYVTVTGFGLMSTTENNIERRKVAGVWYPWKLKGTTDVLPATVE